MRRPNPDVDPEQIRESLSNLLANFAIKLRGDDLRAKVVALIPVFHRLRDLGSSLLPGSMDLAARDRIITYFRRYPPSIIDGDELMVVSGISEWARRLRELRVEFGWSIYSGLTFRDIAEDTSNEDRNALSRSLGAKDKKEWARRVRELRTERGWPISTKNSGRDDLDIGVYVLEEDRQAYEHNRAISDMVRIAVLERDGFRCVECGWNRSKRSSVDPRKFLELHHRRHHRHGGENNIDNLVTLCNVHHDELHRSR